jgi:hypothetical protein
MATYEKNGSISSHFNKERFETYDSLGRKNATKFFEAKGFTLKTNDKTEENKVLYDRTDLLAIKNKDPNISFHIECSVKSTRLWKYVFDGVDVELRKEKYGKEGYNCMSNDDGSEILIIPLMYISLAINSCGKEFAGGTNVKNSPGFIMPEHGCHKVRKYCRRGVGQSGELEDFARVPYKYIYHFKKYSKGYKLYHKPECKLSIKEHLT